MARNREHLAALVASELPEVPADAADWVWLRQVHGPAVVQVDGGTGTSLPEADAAVTAVPALPLVVLTADCAPVVLAAPGAVAVAHAGWRGLAAGVVEAAAAALREVAGEGAPVEAYVGPCIRPGRYEFGADALARLRDRLGPEVVARTASGRPAFDLPAAVRAALARAGVRRVRSSARCTAASPSLFSHRRDGRTGRQATVAVLAP